MRWSRRGLPVLVAVALGVQPIVVSSAAGLEGTRTTVKPYATAVGGDYDVTPLLSAGDVVPASDGSGASYRMVGLPDGIGARPLGDGRSELYVNHELDRSVKSEPEVGRPRTVGAFVSRFVLGADASVLSGERAFDRVFRGDDFVGTTAEEGVAGSAPPFSRFCSGNLAGPPQGLDRWMYLTAEEASGANTFDGKGGVATATFDGEIHALPNLGHYPKENVVVLRGTGTKTVVAGFEDGPAGPESQLYLYVGDKQPSSPSVLARNGLLGGKLYVFRGTGKANEGEFTGGALAGTWAEIANAESLDDTQLEAAADAAGAFGFVRIEDGAQSKTDPRHVFFATTGGSAMNRLGRVYRLQVDLADPVGAGATLTVVDNADTVAGAGGDTAVSPDNVGASSEYLMVQEDATTDSKPHLTAHDRDASIWRYDLDDLDKRRRVVELAPPGRDGTPIAKGGWESSGIIDASDLYGWDSWIFDVQAHGTAAPGGAAQTVEDAQLLLIRPKHTYPLPRPTKGYWAAASDGGIFSFGPEAAFLGSTGDRVLNQPIVDLESTLSTKGYWLAAADGGIFAFGDAPFLGSTGDLTLNQPIVDLARTPSGKGYWLVASDGGVFAFGDARFLGSTGDRALNQPIVAIVPTSTGRGYTLIAADGGVFTFGDASFLGSLGDLKLNQPIVGGDALGSGDGYWLFAADGGVFSFGAAPFLGSAGDLRLNRPIVGGSASADGRGYRLVASDGGVFTYGPDAPFFGSTGDLSLNRPIVALAAVGS